MIQLGPRHHHLRFKTFKWGAYIHLRWRLRWWHCKLAWWKQEGLRVSTRSQKKTGLKPRYVRGYRVAVSWWSTKNGAQQRPFNIGMMFYVGKSPR